MLVLPQICKNVLPIRSFVLRYLDFYAPSLPRFHMRHHMVTTLDSKLFTLHRYLNMHLPSFLSVGPAEMLAFYGSAATHPMCQQRLYYTKGLANAHGRSFIEELR